MSQTCIHKRSLRNLAHLIAIWLVLASSAIAQPAAVAQTVKSLREIKADAMDVQLPVAVRPLLRQLKQQLRELISATLNAQGMRHQTPLQIRANVLAQLAQVGVQVPPPEESGASSNSFDTSYVYGDIHQITIQRPAKHLDLLAVTTTIGICCGQDTSFYLFKKNGKQWQLILAQEANGYADISGAHERFEYALAPPDRRGNFFIVTANVNPWCTSAWQSLRYQVMRVSRDADTPQILLNQKSTIYLGVGPPDYRLRVQAKGFSLTFYGEASPKAISDGEITQRKVLHYAVDGNRVRQANGTKR